MWVELICSLSVTLWSMRYEVGAMLKCSPCCPFILIHMGAIMMDFDDAKDEF